MGCGASRSQEAVVTNENVVTPCFEARDPNAPILVADTGAGFPATVGGCYRQSVSFKEMMFDVVPPGTLPEQHVEDMGSGGDVVKISGSLIMKHPPRKPQRLEEKQTLMAVCSPKHRLATTSGRINQKPSVQDVPEEDEEAAEEEEKAAADV